MWDFSLSEPLFDPKDPTLGQHFSSPGWSGVDRSHLLKMVKPVNEVLLLKLLFLMRILYSSGRITGLPRPPTLLGQKRSRNRTKLMEEEVRTLLTWDGLRTSEDSNVRDPITGIRSQKSRQFTFQTGLPKR